MKEFWAQLPVFWRFQLAGWLVVVLVTFPLKLELTGSFSSALVVMLVRDGTSFLLTLALRLVYRRFWSENGGQMTILIVASCTLAGILQNGLLYILRDFVPLIGEIFRSHFMEYSVFYERTGLLFAWSFLYFGVRHFTEGMQKRLQLAQLEIQMLRAQVNPHFLYNALNSLLVDWEKSRDFAQPLIHSLAGYLRYSLETRDMTFIPLGKELDAMKEYLNVEKSRFRGDLEFDCRIEEETRNLLVPGVVVQPLVENAIKYGRMTSPKPVLVRLVISRPASQLLRIEVSNTGHWFEQEHRRPEGGVGLENLRQRLALLYGKPPAFRVLKSQGWVTVQVDLPTDHETART